MAWPSGFPAQLYFKSRIQNKTCTQQGRNHRENLGATASMH